MHAELDRTANSPERTKIKEDKKSTVEPVMYYEDSSNLIYLVNHSKVQSIKNSGVILDC